MDWISLSQAWFTKSTTTTSRRPLRRRRKNLRWRRMYLFLQADQRLKQNRENLPILVHLQELYLFVKEYGLILNQELNPIKRTSGKKIAHSFSSWSITSRRKWSDWILDIKRLSSERFWELAILVWCNVEEQNGRMWRQQEKISILYWLGQVLHRASKRSGKDTRMRCIGSICSLLNMKDWSSIKQDATQPSFTIGQSCCGRNLSHRMCIQFTFQHKFRIDTKVEEMWHRGSRRSRWLGGLGQAAIRRRSVVWQSWRRQLAGWITKGFWADQGGQTSETAHDRHKCSLLNLASGSTAGNPMNKDHKDSVVPSLIWPNHVLHRASKRSGKDTRMRCIGSTNSLLNMKDWSSIKQDATQPSFTIHSELVVSRKLLWLNMEKSWTRKLMCHKTQLSRTVRPVGGQSFTQLEEIDIDFRVSGIATSSCERSRKFPRSRARQKGSRVILVDKHFKPICSRITSTTHSATVRRRWSVSWAI